MSAPKYDTSNYDAAANKYKELQDKYSGEGAYKQAEAESYDTAKQHAGEIAQTVAENAGGTAGANAQAAARSAGMSRSKAIATGAQMSGNAAANAYGNTYNNAYNNAYTSNLNARLTSNQNAINNQEKLMGMEQQKDTNKYNSDSNRYSAGMGLAGGIFNGIANALSDETKKNISDKTPGDRCDELLKRLRGEK